VERYRFMERAIVVGRGLNYANTFELALKLMETCYVITERFSTADFQHGPIALIERSFPVFLFTPPGPNLQAMTDLLKKLRDLKADTLVISCRPVEKLATRCIRVPVDLDELYTPIPYIIPGQLFAAHLATAKHLDPDTPRQLSKLTRTI
jgi:glutamine---fructose-6-phosphate transaminase (isomerizing)